MGKGNRQSAVPRRKGPVKQITHDERATMTMLLRAKAAATEAHAETEIALATATLNYQKFERRLSETYKLNTGDGIAADGTIQRKQG